MSEAPPIVANGDEYGVRFHPKAEDDFTDIWDFLAADSPDAADRVTDEIIGKISGLVKFPHQGHRRTDLTSRPLRFVRLYDYLIAYAAWIEESGFCEPVCRDTGGCGFTVKYSVRAAQMAVYDLFGIQKKIPPVTPHDKSLRTELKAVAKAFA